MNYFDTDNRKFAKEFVDYGVFSTDDTLPYKASEESAMGEYVHPLKDMRSIKLNKIKDKNIDSMNDNKIRLTESQLHRVIKESVKRVLREGNVIGSDYFPEGTNPNTKDGYLRLLVGKFVIEDGMDSMQALKKANEIINQKFGK